MIQPNFSMGSAAENIKLARQKFVGHILERRAFLTPDKPALEWQGKIWDYKTLNQQVNSLANGLVEKGVQRGERVAMLSDNCGECVHLLYANAKIGSILAFLNWRYTEEELFDAIELIEAETLVVSAKYQASLLSILHRLPWVKRLVLLDSKASEISGQSCEVLEFSSMIEDFSTAEPQIPLHEEDALYIVYTSGTTGKPKGAVISQRAEINRTIAYMATFPLLMGTEADDSVIVRGPFFHVTSVHEVFSTHALGGKAIILAGYNPVELVDILEREQISWLSLSPGMYDRLIDEIKSRDTRPKGIRAIGSLPDVVPHNQIHDLTVTAGAPFLNTYGLTEIGMENFSINMLPIGHEGVNYDDMGKEESFFAQVRLLDSDGNEVPDGSPGELVMRSTMMFSGYWNNDKVNAEVFRGGWFHTGDVLRRTPEGKLEFVSRTKYLIKSGGENIYPAEIERILLTHPAVTEACVVGARHPKWGETPVAFIALSEPAEESELIAHCRQNLAKYRVPNVIEAVDIDRFPRNLTGKVLREKVEEWIPEIQDRIT